MLDGFHDVILAMMTSSWILAGHFNHAFPFISILYTTSVEAFALVGPARSIYLFNVLLWVLQVLHVIWFMIIIKAAYKAIVTGVVSVPLLNQLCLVILYYNGVTECNVDVHNLKQAVFIKSLQKPVEDTKLVSDTV